MQHLFICSKLYLPKPVYFSPCQIVTALSIAGDLGFNPETDELTGADGKIHFLT